MNVQIYTLNENLGSILVFLLASTEIIIPL